jgi:hypothetical protein
MTEDKGHILLEESDSHVRLERRLTIGFVILTWAVAVISSVAYLASEPELPWRYEGALFIFTLLFLLGTIGVPTALWNRPTRICEKGVDNLRTGYGRQFAPFEDIWYAIIERKGSWAVVWFYFKRRFLGMTWGGFFAEGDDGFMDRLQEMIDFLNSKGVKAGFKREMAAIGVKVGR